MTRFLTLCTLMVSLTIFACGPSEETQPAQSGKSTAEKVTEAAKAVGEEVKEKAQAAAEKTEEMAAAASVKAGEMASEAKHATKEMAEAAAEKAHTAAVAATMAADKAVEAAKKAVTPETLVFEASYGTVSFPHAQHQAAYECATCHGDRTPGRFGLDKEKAHALCRDCHKQEGAGPTACAGCHEK